MTPPSIVAFTVAPTSGDAPYIFTAQFSNSLNIDGVRYVLSLRASTSTGSCPPLGITTDFSGGATSLLESGEYASNTGVPAGSCRAFTLRIRDNVLGTDISTETVYVDNV